jgi:protein-tyrosine phosphatase
MKIINSILLLVLLSTGVFAQSNVGMQGSPNFRELGGLINKEGRSLKEGMLYRSGSFADLKGEDVTLLRQTGINTIVDFRSDSEIAREPDFIPEGMQVNYLNAPIGSLDQKGMGKFMQVLTKPDFKEADVEQLMIEANLGFVDYIADFKPLFDQVQAPETVVLFHCTAGKDRTGLASSLLLHILDFDRATIFEDFMLSNAAVSKLDLSKMTAYGIPQDRAGLLMGVKESYLEAAWTAIETKYGSVDAMLQQVFGIDQKVKSSLKAKYLVD